MTDNRTRAIAVAQSWLKRADINPQGELALVAQEFLNEVDQRDPVAERFIELPSWPFY